MKFSTVVLLFATIFVAYTEANRLNRMWGEIGLNDIVIHKSRFSKDKQEDSRVMFTKIITQKEDRPALSITAIVVNNLMDGNGASARIISGGPGHKEAKLKFTSKNNYGIHNEVIVFGHLDAQGAL